MRPPDRAALRNARKVQRAAAVKPVQGDLPRNHGYAGKVSLSLRK